MDANGDVYRTIECEIKLYVYPKEGVGWCKRTTRQFMRQYKNA